MFPPEVRLPLPLRINKFPRDYIDTNLEALIDHPNPTRSPQPERGLAARQGGGRPRLLQLAEMIPLNKC